MSFFANDDFFFNLGGDFVLGPDGDILDLDKAAQPDSLIRAKQAIMHRVVCEKNGWRLYPQICGALEQFLGQPITEELIRGIKRQVNYVLTLDGLFEPKDLVIQVFDMGAGTEVVMLVIYVKGVSDKPVFVSSFDMQNGQISQVL